MKLYPNPVSSSRFNMDYYLTRSTPISVQIIDLSGRIVQEQYLGLVHAGKHKLENDISGLPDGVYLVKMITSEKSITNRLIIQ